MRFLIYDKNEKDLHQLCSLIKGLSADFVVDCTIKSTDFFSLFEDHHYDVVFIDFIDNASRQIIAHIQHSKPQQKLAILSSRHECINNTRKCKVCKNDYNIKRIPKPFRYTDLFFVLENTQCAFDFDEKYTASMVMDIIKKFGGFDLDTQSLQIRYEEFHNISKEIIKLCEELKANNIDYEVTHNNYIQVIERVV